MREREDESNKETNTLGAAVIKVNVVAADSISILDHIKVDIVNHRGRITRTRQ